MSNVAHDVRGAMQAIAGYATLLDEEANGSLKPQQLQYIEYIKAGAKRAQEAIERCQAGVDELVRSKSGPK